MPRRDRTLTRDDILSLEDYESIRPEKRAESIGRKRHRRLALGPDGTVIFENWDTMWLQVHEMLRAEKGGDDQLVDELAAYNPMVPGGRELTATLMFEIDDPARRADLLGRLGGVEDCIFIELGDDRIAAVAEDDVVRSNDAGKASAVHFLHFPFSDDQARRWQSGEGKAMIGIDHRAYRHIAMIGEDIRRELARDFA